MSNKLPWIMLSLIAACGSQVESDPATTEAAFRKGPRQVLPSDDGTGTHGTYNCCDSGETTASGCSSTAGGGSYWFQNNQCYFNASSAVACEANGANSGSWTK